MTHYHRALRIMSLVSAALALSSTALAVSGAHIAIALFPEIGTTHCPDSDQDGRPCGSDCGCLCCPGHVRAFCAPAPALVPAPSPSAGELPPMDDELHPIDLVRRLFHPPRPAAHSS